MTTAFIFPGQGSQKVGMGKDLYDQHKFAKAAFDEVDDALNQKLSKIIFEGPIEELTLTLNTQPALMACSIAMLRVLEDKHGAKILDLCSHVAGHSLGELTALIATGALSLSDGAKVLRARGKAMQAAMPEGKGGMFALLGANIEVAEEIAKQSNLQVANDNAPSQQVLSGELKNIEAEIALAKEQGYKAIQLKVSAAFHSKFMAPAQDALRKALDSVKIQQPSLPLIANLSADVLALEDIKENLVKQIVSRVRWVDSIRKLENLGVTKIIEVGPGKVCTNLVKQISPDIDATYFEEL